MEKNKSNLMEERPIVSIDQSTDSNGEDSAIRSPFQGWVMVALTFILLLGALFRFVGVNWDDFQHLHPDERFLTMVETAIQLPGSQDVQGELPPGCAQWGGYFDADCSPLNPYNRSFGNFVYGTFPLFVVKFVGELVKQNGYDQIHLIGRYLSGLFDLVTVALIFFIGRRLYGKRVGLLAALFLAASVLDIQQSHFFTVDTFANVPLLLAFWFALDIIDGRNSRLSFVLAGAFFGLSLAARINLLPFAGIIGLAAFVYVIRRVKAPGAAPAFENAKTFAFATESPADSAMGAASARAASEDPPEFSTTRVFNLGPLTFEVEAVRHAPSPEIAARAEEEQTAPVWWTSITTTAIGLGLSAIAAFVAFRLAQPYAFKGLFGLNPKFLADMSYARDLIAGQLDIPPMHQWTARPDYWFPWVNMLLWGLGPAVGIAGSLGFILAGIQMIRSRQWQHLLIFFWVGGMFLYLGQQVAKTDRYYLPLYPFVGLFAAYLLVRLWDVARHGDLVWLTTLRARVAQVLVAVVALVTIGYTLFWATAFTSIYTRPVTRVDASRWIYENVPAGAVLGNEHWDDPIPLRVDGKDGFSIYKGVELQWYGEDTPEKRDQAVEWLDQVAYINLTSNRLYLSIPRLPLRYPLTTKYYEWLFDGKLGFELVKTFTSRPSFLGIEINDDDAEESFTVYDHPKVLIFKKTPQYSHENTVALFESVDLSEVIRQTPLDFTLSHDAFQLTPQDQVADYGGGTWSEIFNPDDWVNHVPIVVWLVLLELLGLLAFPVCFAVLRSFADRGYAFAKALGILALGWGAWTLASYHVIGFSRTSISIVLFAMVLLAAFAAWRQRRDLVDFVRVNFRLLLIEELVFFTFFLLFLLIRYGNPELWHPFFGGEKPMDFAYLNAIIKTTWFPPYNPWFEGGYINYYYFGQLISATLVRLTGILPEVTYNLLIPMFFALTALGAFGVAFNLVNAIGRRQTPAPASSPFEGEGRGEVSLGGKWSARAFAAGLLAAFFVVIIGNLGQVGVLGSALMQLGQPLESRIPGFGGAISILSGAFAWLIERKPLPVPIGNWYWTATRIIPDTINEFPFFTFLYADLHAHLMALAYTLVALAFGLHAVLIRARFKWYDLGVIALVLGALRAINTWDYPTYLAVIGAAMAIGYFSEHSAVKEGAPGWNEGLQRYLSVGIVAFVQALILIILTNALGIKVTLDVITYGLILAFGLVLGWIVVGGAFDPRKLTRVLGWRFIGLIALSVLFYYPFIANYGTAYTSVELWKESRTNLQEYFWVHGIFLFMVVSYLIVENYRARSRSRVVSHDEVKPPALPVNDWLVYALPGLAVFETALIVLNFRVLAFVFPLVLLAVWLLLRRETTPERRFIALLIVAALLMTFMVEVITLKGDIGRMNTVFKFYLQAWVLFAVTSAAGLTLIFDWRLPARFMQAAGSDSQLAPTLSLARNLKQVWWGILGLLLFAGLLYPEFATWAKVNDRFVAGGAPGLNGLDYMRDATYSVNNHDFPLVQDYEAIQWLRENIKGSPVIAEANYELYRWNDRVSINTGLPTIIGWDWHTKQQYSLLDGAIIDHRREDVAKLYNTADSGEATDLLRRYKVSYVYVGPLERALYDANGLSKFEAMTTSGALSMLYDADDVQIYQVNAPANAKK
jgi:YYY domain-containing protein